MLPYHLRPPPVARRRSREEEKDGTAVVATKTAAVAAHAEATNQNRNGGGGGATTGDGGGVENDESFNESFLFRNESNDHGARGGPIQQAALRDLRELRPDFVLFLNSSNNNGIDDGTMCRTTTTTTTRPAEQPSVGTAFGVFREVFRRAKVAALHSSRFVAAHRCDVNAHAQLLYAACFQLLHEPFLEQQQHCHDNDSAQQQQQQDDVNQQQTWHGDNSTQSVLLELHAIFAVFCLYALYETNPLPLAPSHVVSSSSSSSQAANIDKSSSSSIILSTLPCGLSNRENPKLVYRRYYRHGIRIDRKGYARLLQVRELARARIAARQAASLSSSCDGAAPAAAATAASTDVLLVLERLWSKLVLSEYTGPRGLEGLAGHEDYPFPPVPPPSVASTASFPKSSRAEATTVAEKTTNAADTAKFLVQQIMASGSSSQATTAAATATVDNDTNDDDGSKKKNDGVTSLSFSDSLQSHLRAYLAARRAIRLPAFINNAKSSSSNTNAAAVPVSTTTTTSRLVQERIRKALQPIFDQQGQQQHHRKQRQQQRPMDPFLQIVNYNAMSSPRPAANGAGDGGVSVAAAAGAVRDDPTKHNSDDDGGGNGSQNKPRTLHTLQAVRQGEPSCRSNGGGSIIGQDNDAESSYELIIPDNLPASLRESISVAVRTLVDRDKDSFFTLPQPQTAAAGVVTDRVEEDNDAENDDGSGAATIDDNDDGRGGGAGHEALAALIAQAAAATLGTAGQTKMKNTPRVAFLDSTRDVQEDESRISRTRRRGVRRLQKEEDDDNFSDASSTVGQRALEDLLTITMAMGKSPAAAERKKQPAEPRKRPARKGAAMREQPRKRTRKKSTSVDMEQQDAVDEYSADDSEDDEDEEESIDGEGNAALELLLGRALM